ncbi:zinc-binding dehydrogenase [Colletotrichum chrysophilum]|uniref:Dehydrogenase FUB6 n=1 Tax=Colletotrichum chrysophilum TaxID=1836956 RepID=A0AAD9AGK9_9PEZI|nr:zinc-binding dehydrogenase [Colletotrichum chrysophilum]
MSRNLGLVFSEVPDSVPVAGKHLKVVQQESFDLTSDPPTGGFTSKVLFASFDPYLRHRLVSKENARDGFEPLAVGTVVPNSIIAEVIRTDTQEFSIGDNVLGMGPIQEYVTVSGSGATHFTRLPKLYDISPSLYLGALGMPGLTAYSALYSIGQPKTGEVIFISAASGAVGQIVAQLAKREGLTVIGSVGSDEKLRLLTNVFGFDGGFNYNNTAIADILPELAPHGIDIYYDNVGGEQLEVAIGNMKAFGRIIACGYASQYNIPVDRQYGIRTTSQIIGKRITWKELSVFDEDMGGKYRAEHQVKVGKWIADGTLKAIESRTKGIENAAEGLIDLFDGKSFKDIRMPAAS